MLCVLDIYQALTEERPYRQALSHEDSMQIIWKLVDIGDLDEQIAKKVELIFQKENETL
ncbi:hypothetical protein [Anaerosporobacter sp.]|uniref:hypothetical protein n=1 Tax=Anaerosporobacter sp. TaxID=1872529 RepID=UPI003FA4D4F6